MQQQPLFEGDPTQFGLVGDSPQLQGVLRTIAKLKTNESPVLIVGESGVGKELVARALHAASPLGHRKFLPLDAASLVGSLMESELFGHVKGAFTGAIESKIGLVRAAEGGTLFLDEIGELTPEVQAKLLRLLQEKEIRPIGATQPIKVHVRILAATNRDLPAAVAEGTFRQDLYYRLNVIRIRIPPLRERRSDIPLLVDRFLEKYAVNEVSLSDDVLARLMRHPWPGNVRELENVIRAMVALRSNPMIEINDLPTKLRGSIDPSQEVDVGLGSEIVPLAEVERRHILKAIEHTRGDVQTAALLLGIGRTTLYRKLKAYRGKTGETRDALGPDHWPLSA